MNCRHHLLLSLPNYLEVKHTNYASQLILQAHSLIHQIIMDFGFFEFFSDLILYSNSNSDKNPNDINKQQQQDQQQAQSNPNHQHHHDHHHQSNRHHNLLSDLFNEDEDVNSQRYNELLEEGKEFYTFVRTHVIYFTTFILLYALSCTLISYFSKQRDEYRLDIEEYKTYKISTWMCAFTLAISIAAFLLLPVSITTNEITWIDDAQTKSSLLNGMWSYVFLFSNLSLFILLPFAYFFTESEGFAGSQRGLLSRFRETFVLLIIVIIIVLGLTYTLCCLFFGLGCHVSTIQLLTIWQYLPFLYSCISFIGALLLLICTPLGISHLFTVLRQLDSIQRAKKLNVAALVLLLTLAGYSVMLVFINTFQLLVGYRPLPLSTTLNMAQQQSDTTLDKLIAESNSKQQMVGIKNPVGAFLDIVMVLYLWSASLCGLYNLPGLCCLRPRKNNSSFNQIIGNCAILCLLSSALPLLARTLGMTNFDLLSDFGRIEWLGNFYVVLLYNVVFFVSTTLCLLGKREFVLTINLFKAMIGNPHQTLKKIKSEELILSTVSKESKFEKVNESSDEKTTNENNSGLKREIDLMTNSKED